MTNTGGRGMLAMQDAGRALFSPAFTTDSVSFAGSLDTVLTHQLFTLNNVPYTDANLNAFRTRYTAELSRRLAEPDAGHALPGVLDLLAALRNLGSPLPGTPTLVLDTPTLRVGSTPRPTPTPSSSPLSPTLAVLTGNFRTAGVMKLRACGIDPEWFTLGVFADDAPHSEARPALREHLVRVGLDRYHAHHGRHIAPARAVVIGDTPHDVQCGRAHGCRTLAVATGRYSTRELQAAGADRAVDTLADTQDILNWLQQP